MYNEPITQRAPSRRNREIFHAVRVELKSLREVAKERELSAGRVGRIVKQVEKWIGETAGSAKGTNWTQRLFVMEEIHRQRLDLLFQQALAGWAKSQEDTHIHKLKQVTGKPEVREVIVKSSAGDRRFLETALKIEESRRKFEEESEQIQDAPAEQAGTGEEAIANCELGIAKEEVTSSANADVVSAAASSPAPAPLEIPNSQSEIRSGDDLTTQPLAESPPAPSPIPAAKQPMQLQSFRPRVLSEDQKRALIHPSKRLPRGEW